MKKLFITAFLMLTSLGIMAQEQEEQAVRKFTLMPKFGVNIAEFVNNSGSIYVDGSPRWGFTAGLEAECYLANRWGLTLGLMYSQQGQKYNSSYGMYYGEPTVQMDYINLPVLAKWYMSRNKKWALKFGLQPGLNVKSCLKSDSFSKSLDDMGVDVEPFDMALALGFGFEHRNITLEITSFVGYIKPFSTSTEKFDDRNSVTQFTLGYRFDL